MRFWNVFIDLFRQLAIESVLTEHTRFYIVYENFIKGLIKG